MFWLRNKKIVFSYLEALNEPLCECFLLITFAGREGSGEHAPWHSLTLDFTAPTQNEGMYSKTCLKRPLKKRQNKDLNDKW